MMNIDKTTKELGFVEGSGLLIDVCEESAISI